MPITQYDSGYDRRKRKREWYREYHQSAGFKLFEEMKCNGFQQIDYGRYSYCSGAVVIYVDNLDMEEKESGKNVRRLMQMFTLPKFRGQGHALRTLHQIVYCSELSGCCIAAVANPFKLTAVNEQTTVEEVARKLDAHYAVNYDRDETSERMQRLLTKAGFSNWKIDPKFLENKSIGPDRCFMYVPGSVDRDFLKEFKPQIVKQNKSVEIEKKINLMLRYDLQNGIRYG